MSRACWLWVLLLSGRLHRKTPSRIRMLETTAELGIMFLCNLVTAGPIAESSPGSSSLHHPYIIHYPLAIHLLADLGRLQLWLRTADLTCHVIFSTCSAQRYYLVVSRLDLLLFLDSPDLI